MVVEFLTFEVEPTDREEWLRVEEAVWSAELRRRSGFIRKEIWLSDDDPKAVHAAIWWSDRASWKAIGPAEVAAVDAAMGDWLRQPSMRSFQVLRER